MAVQLSRQGGSRLSAAVLTVVDFRLNESSEIVKISSRDVSDESTHGGNISTTRIFVCASWSRSERLKLCIAALVAE